MRGKARSIYYTENYKTLLKEIELLNKWKDTPVHESENSTLLSRWQN